MTNLNKKIIVKFHHASLIVKDLEAALTFYQEVLGLDVDSRRPDLGYSGAWLILPGEQQIHLMVLDNPDKNSQRPEHGGRDHHIAFSVSSIESLMSSLKVFGTTFTQSKSGRKALFCRDPDGNALEFIQS